ncbi:hypothetical protein DPMN_119738 [Dreissena polymorpha]|uniref:Uncharacterized protein n=1 Tax=Dreissena polymorpha TaxID=45954 RepID=A0A9D4GJS7_DREPO|nr:hypothetical protein DPMN_119738 [Dreissena polymorpha]
MCGLVCKVYYQALEQRDLQLRFTQAGISSINTDILLKENVIPARLYVDNESYATIKVGFAQLQKTTTCLLENRQY